MFRLACLGLSAINAVSLKLEVLEVADAPPAAVDALNDYSLELFAQHFNRTYKKGTSEWTARENTYKKNHARLLHLRAKKDSSWTAGITKFMDYHENEYMQLLGYRGRRQKRAISVVATERDVEDSPANASHNYTFPPVFTAATKGKKLTAFVRDQGQCGSCWAEAAISVLEGAAETYPELLEAMRKRAKKLNARLETISSQAMVSCTPNKKHCGGTGGCDGATAELGYDMVKDRGLPMAAEWSYSSGQTGKEDACTDKHFKSDFRLTISGYKVLPSNKYQPLIEALVKQQHPIAVAVDATNWNFYEGGIYSDTDEGKGEFTVNHEVTLVGFTMPSDKPGKNGKGYYHIKNSWGEAWGEQGFIRVEMKPNEDEHCGWDMDTHIGLACDGDPDKAWVCGTCGILYDTIYPVGLKKFGKKN